MTAVIQESFTGRSKADRPRSRRACVTTRGLVSRPTEERLVGSGLQTATFADEQLERDFIAYCQMVTPLQRDSAAFESRLAELTSQAIKHVVYPEFTCPDSELAVCGSTLLEPLRSDIVVEAWPEVPGTIAALCATRLLSVPEERSVVRRMHYLKHRAWKLLTAESIDQWGLSRAEGLLRAARWHRDLMVQSNMRLVVSIVRKMRVSPLWYEELVSEGAIALMRALHKFDPRKGYRFCTYATPVIRRECFKQTYERNEDRSRYARSSVLSLLELTRGRNAAHVDRAHWIAWRKELVDLLPHLSRREQVIIRSRYGLGTHRRVRTLQRLASALKISKERVRQLEHSALVKLRVLAESSCP